MAELLVTDHGELDRLGGALLDAFDPGDAAGVLPKLDVVWARLAVHIRAEHLHLFPALLAASAAGDGRAGGGPSGREVEEALSRLREDHNFFMREMAACVEAVRRLAAGGGAEDGEDLAFVRRRVIVIFERLREHNRLEEEEVYHWPRSLLGGAERERLDAAVRRELQNLPPRFDANRD
jgi:hypothetical protein